MAQGGRQQGQSRDDLERWQKVADWSQRDSGQKMVVSDRERKGVGVCHLDGASVTEQKC